MGPTLTTKAKDCKIIKPCYFLEFLSRAADTLSSQKDHKTVTLHAHGDGCQHNHESTNFYRKRKPSP